MKKIKIIFFIAVILSTTFVLSEGLPKAGIHQARPTIKIGALGPLAITPGNDMKKGVEMAVEEINSGDGVNVGGTIYDFELIIETSSGSLGIPDPTVGITSAVKLILDDNVTALIGGFRTEVILGIQMQTNILDRPFLGVGSAAPIVSPHFWRVGSVNVSGIARNIIDLYGYGLVPDMGVRNITIIREEAAWTEAMGISIKNYFAQMYGFGLQPLVQFTDDIVLPVTYTQNEVTTTLAGLKAPTFGTNDLQVNALMTFLSDPVGRYVPPAWTANDLPQILAGLNVESQVSTYFDETEGACYGEIELETCPPDVEPNENTAPFRTAYEALFDEGPTYTAFASYDAVYVLKEAIEDADSLAYDNIEASLANIEYEGTAYLIKFTSEPGPHWTVAINETTGMPYYVPILRSEAYPDGVPLGTFDVHDLYTNGTYGKDGRPHNIGYWTQWQKNGVKKTVWHDPAANETKGFNDQYTPTDNQRNITKGNLLWPIDHNEHGWVPEPTSETETTTAMPQTEEPECEDNDPEVTIIGIEDDSTYSGSVIIGVSVTDENKIKEATIQIEYGAIDKTYEIALVLAAGTWTGSYDLDTTGFPDETYDVTIRVYDVCGNVETIRLNITFDNDIDQSTGTETEEKEETSTEEPITLETPGFELLAVVFILGNLALVVKRQKRKKG